MGRAKEIILKVVPAKIANDFVRKHHYSGKVVNNSTVHFGCFLDGAMHGVLSYGNSLQKSNIVGLVKDTGWNEFIELNRMAFNEYLPKNSESRCIAISVQLLKKYAPHIKWIVSFADAAQCGDGTIYRASGFYLTGIKKATDYWRLPNGQTVLGATLRLSGYTSWLKPYMSKEEFTTFRKGGTVSGPVMEKIGAQRLLGGYNLRYILFIDKSCEKKLTCPIIPYSAIKKEGASMYKGKKVIFENARIA